MTELNWAIIGPGIIAEQFAKGMSDLKRTIYAVGARNKTKGELFAKKFGIAKVYDDFNLLLGDPGIDIVYISTPHSTHYELMIKALNHGKHVLTEKSITVNSKELEEVNLLANKKGLIVAEAMTIFHMPLYLKLADLKNSGKLGKLKMIQVSFGSLKDPSPDNRFFSKELAGGALLDIGTYACSFARFFLSSQPEEILTTVKKYETGVDEQSAIILKNKAEEMAIISLAFRAKMPKRGIVAYEKGFITVEDFPRADQAVIQYANSKKETIKAGVSNQALIYEIINMEQSIIKGINERHSLTIDVIEIMSKVRKKWKITYPFEK